jgi:hypothetical protein
VRRTDTTLPNDFIAFEWTAYPTGDIPVEGQLIAVDDPTFDFQNMIFLEANASITLRIDETLNLTGTDDFAWETDVTSIYVDDGCLIMQDSNLGGFETGYRQIWFQARNDTENCTAILTMTNVDTAITVPPITVQVGRGYCP